MLWNAPAFGDMRQACRVQLLEVDAVAEIRILGVTEMRRDAIAIKKQDNVATAIRNMDAGASVTVGIEDEIISVIIADPISLGHKLALRPIRSGESIIKYGAVIGQATKDIALGEHVHVHNVGSTRGRGDLA